MIFAASEGTPLGIADGLEVGAGALSEPKRRKYEAMDHNIR